MRWPWQKEATAYYFFTAALRQDAGQFHDLHANAQNGYWNYLADQLRLLRRVSIYIEKNLSGLFYLDSNQRLVKSGVVCLKDIPQGKIEISEGDMTLMMILVDNKHRVLDGCRIARVSFADGTTRNIIYSYKLGLCLD